MLYEEKATAGNIGDRTHSLHGYELVLVNPIGPAVDHRTLTRKREAPEVPFQSTPEMMSGACFGRRGPNVIITRCGEHNMESGISGLLFNS